MREIEILSELYTDIDAARSVLSMFHCKGSKHTIDTYFYDKLRNNLQPTMSGKLLECCRLRERDGQFFVTYKVDHYSDKIWSYSDEYETEVQDITAMENIFKHLGLEKLVVIDNVKHTYESSEYEIVLEQVKDLGNFIEVEFKKDDGTLPVDVVKQNILKFISSLGLQVGDELNAGKPELLLNKKDI